MGWLIEEEEEEEEGVEGKVKLLELLYLTWKNCLVVCDICASLWSLLHLQRLACPEGNCNFRSLPNLRGERGTELVC